MVKTTKVKKTKTYTGKPKSIGPKFFAILLIFIIAIFSLVSNLIILRTVRDEMRISFDYELRTALEVLAGNIDTLYEADYSATTKTLALQMVDNATWNDGHRHFWATPLDSTEILAGKEDHEYFYSAYAKETKFGFLINAGFDEAYFNANAYPKTEEYIRVSTCTTLVIALFALGACVIAFHRSTR
ncbi:hypothetical protein FWF89_00155 [Candidatus Saccharibacteria bacterium]|nr:hypothetical protein [Candidatus Saccharibacteria bacterium]